MATTHSRGEKKSQLPPSFRLNHIRTFGFRFSETFFSLSLFFLCVCACVSLVVPMSMGIFRCHATFQHNIRGINLILRTFGLLSVRRLFGHVPFESWTLYSSSIRYRCVYDLFWDQNHCHSLILVVARVCELFSDCICYNLGYYFYLSFVYGRFRMKYLFWRIVLLGWRKRKKWTILFCSLDHAKKRYYPHVILAD